MTRRRLLFTVMSGLLAFSGEARAQCLALEGGQLALPGARPTVGTLVIQAATITAAGDGVIVPAGCTRVSMTGKVITAGLIDGSSSLGVDEISLEPSTREDDAGGELPIRAAFRVEEGYNPRSSLIPVARLGGVTSAVVMPTGGLISGQAAWVDLRGVTQADVVERAPLAMVANLSDNAGASLRTLRELLDDARQFITQQTAWERGQSRAFGVSRVELMALRPLLERKIPLVVGADRASDIEALLRFAAEQKIRVVIRGAAEGHLLSQQLAKAGVGVLIDPLVCGPGGFDQVRGRRENAARLQAAGVTVAIGAFSEHNLRKLRQLAGNAVRDGMPWEAALDSITGAPARLFGMQGYGTLSAASVANLAVWSGDPLELSTQLEQLYIHGRRIELKSRQSELLQRYRKLPGTPRPALSLP